MSSKIRTRSIMTCLALVLLASCVGSEPADPGSSARHDDDAGCLPESGVRFSQLAPALAEADDGDTIVIGPGTYQGGIAIEHSIAIKGAGVGATRSSGAAEPVVTIGVFEAADQPTVTIEGVTITGGLTRSSPLPPMVSMVSRASSRWEAAWRSRRAPDGRWVPR